MSINIYKTDFGYFSIVADDAILTKVRSMSKGQIFNNNTLTDLGKNLISGVPLSSLYNTIMANSTEVDKDVYNNMTSLFPSTIIKQLSNVTTETTSETFTIDANRSIEISYRYYMHPADLRARSYFHYNSLTYNTPNTDCPYGYLGSSTSGGADANYIAITVLITNSNLTDFESLSVFFDNKNARMTHSKSNNNAFLTSFFKGLPITHVSSDPYNNGGNSNSGGGGGTFGGGNTIFGGNSDSIDVPPLPTASASSAGFITLFNPSLAQLNNLANYMWSDLFSLDTFKKIFADPMDCILGLSIVPVKPASAGTSNVKIGNVSTDVAMNKTSSQYVAVDCGTIDVKEYWGAYLDYAPYTQCEIYLPYVGTKQISVDDVMNKAVHVVYHVDILSGACNAYVKCGNSVLYTFVGQCSSSIPISGNDWTNVLNGAISVAGKIGLAMATGGATALMSGLGAASSIISSSKPTVERSGAMSSTGGLLGIQKPYLILTRPKQALPENQNKYTGYPSFITMALSDCTGYTEIDSIHLENMSCTDEEAQEIESLLKSGVIF